jgi:hypothetical protein
VTSKASLFDALKGVVLQGDIENNVRNILREYPTSQVKRQKNFIENHSWKSVAAEHLKLFGANEIPVEI